MPKMLYSDSAKVPSNLSKIQRKRERYEKRTHRRWRVEYDLIYDGGTSKWNGYYRTLIGAKIAATLNVKIRSWGGDAILFDQWEGE